MSFRIEVVPEDPTNNGYILQPLVERMLVECGRPQADVHVLSNPKTRGYDQARELLKTAIIDRYRHKDLILFLPDADGKDRSAELSALEKLAEEKGARLLCCAAVQEVEVWLLAEHLSRIAIPWPRIREDTRVKETVFDSFLERHGDSRRAGGGRDTLMKEGLAAYGALLQRCPELKTLQERIKELLGRR